MSNPVVESEQAELTERMVLTATELGINVVQIIAAETLKKNPGISLKDFTHVLDQYATKSKDAVNKGQRLKDIKS